MTQKEKIQRRRLIGLLGIGGAATFTALPSAWTKPVIDAVLLPAHAQASPLPPITVTTPPPVTPPITVVPPPVEPPPVVPPANTCEGETGKMVPSTNSIDFSSAGSPHTFFIDNPTVHPIENISTSIEGDFAGNYEITKQMSSSLGAGGLTTLGVQFKPGALCPPNKPESRLIIRGTSCGVPVTLTLLLFAQCALIGIES